MAGPTPESELTTPSLRFALATKENDAAIRRLLRENPMSGKISLTFEHEPDYFISTQIAGASTKTIVGFLNEELLGVGRCTYRDCFVNSKVLRVGYLSELRMDAKVQGRFDLLRRAYKFTRQVCLADPADFYFTSIAADNERSRRVFERGLPGLPVYKFAADFVTLLVPVSRRAAETNQKLTSSGLKMIIANKAVVGKIVSGLNSYAQQNQLGAVWTEAALLSLEDFGLSLSDFRLLLDQNDSLVACAALWDQRRYKQIVVRGYAREVSLARPFVNLFAKLFGTTRLPPLGSVLGYGYLSPLCCRDAELLVTLIKSILPAAAQRGLEFLSLGFSAGDTRLAAVRRHFRCREYHTRLYQVVWDPSKELVLDNRPFLPDLALL
jgi:hypothetical protein